MIEKYSCYDFSIKSHDVPGCINGSGCDWVKGYYYVIYEPHYKPCDSTIFCEGDEYLDTEQEARFAAIDRIVLLENGEWR